MRVRIGKSGVWALGVRIAALCALLSGCSSSPAEFYVFADSGKYQYYTCQQLANIAKAQAIRERDLKELIDKAEQSAGGVIVSVMAYRADYLAVNEDLRVIETTLRAKNCDTPTTWRSNGAIQ
jgi:hypothetical protein